MIDGKKILAVIPARGGSKRIKNKNIQNLGEKPLIAWTIEAAQKSQYIDDLMLSSDDNLIIDTAKQYKCPIPFVRPHRLATDTAKTNDVLLHLLEHIPNQYDYLIALQPTSPFRTTEDIDNALKKCIDSKHTSLVSVTPIDKPLAWVFFTDQDILKALPDAHLLPQHDKTVILNGAIYIVHIPWFQKQKTLRDNDSTYFLMPLERSLDIDTPFDFHLAQALWNTKTF